MTLGVMSDTHGNVALMHSVADTMVERFGAGVIFHLGDDYADAEQLVLAGHDVRLVPGLWCPEYHDGRIPKRLSEVFDGLAVACAHAEKDLRHTERRAAIVLTGHTHVAAIQTEGRSLYVNPGHLRSSTSRGEAPSYAIIDIGPERVSATIRELNGHVRTACSVERSHLSHGQT